MQFWANGQSESTTIILDLELATWPALVYNFECCRVEEARILLDNGELSLMSLHSAPSAHVCQS
jgi:hypothetical protein